MTSSIAPIEIILRHPCETTAISSTGVPDQNYFLWQLTNDPNLASLSVSLPELKCAVTTSLGVSCGQFTYTVATVILAPDDPAIIANMSVDPVG